MTVKINDKAVSEAIGFVLILGLVLTGIGLVTLYGYPVLVKEQSSTDVKNMERAMIVIQNDMKSLCFKNVPYKESTLQVSGGTLEVIDSSDSKSSFKIETSSGWTYPTTGSLKLGELRYRSDRSTEVITLENGAVMTRQEGAAGSAMLAEPRWFCDVDPITNKKTFVIYLMNISAGERMAKSGMTTVRMKRLDTSPIPPIQNPDIITVTYNNPSDGYSTAWKNYLTSPTVGMKQKGGFQNTYEISGVNKLVIKEYEIKILGI